MPSTVQVKCKCGAEFTARTADRKRGWAKSCAASRRDNSKYYFAEKRSRYENEFGGIANFDSSGEYAGFQCTGFDNTKNQ